jgi:hypothetical protein
MRALAVVAVLAVPALARADDKPKPKLEIEPSASQKEIYPDENVGMKAVIRNAGKSDVQVMRNVDGAFDGLRGPVSFKWVVKREGQLVPRRKGVVRIDNFLNTIKIGDIITVEAGKTTSLYVDNFDTYYELTAPGKYTIELRYEFDPTAGDKMDDKAKAALKNLTGVSITGKTELTILPFPLAFHRGGARRGGRAAQARHRESHHGHRRLQRENGRVPQEACGGAEEEIMPLPSLTVSELPYSIREGGYWGATTMRHLNKDRLCDDSCTARLRSAALHSNGGLLCNTFAIARPGARLCRRSRGPARFG